jgi:AcrR family transcriptional regulator
MVENRGKPENERGYHHGDLRRALIEAALELLKEEQNWMFSLREVARRAGVSHNAPYNHFADKSELLAELGAAGFASLRSRLLASIVGVHRADTALVKSGIAYVKFGVENPALYRLMFGTVLGSTDSGRPRGVVHAANESRAVLVSIVQRGARAGVFPGLDDESRLRAAVLSAWSIVHGFTMLVLDGFLGGVPQRDIGTLTQTVAQTVANGLMRSKPKRTER